MRSVNWVEVGRILADALGILVLAVAWAVAWCVLAD
jgi:hypothetical protein